MQRRFLDGARRTYGLSRQTVSVASQPPLPPSAPAAAENLQKPPPKPEISAELAYFVSRRHVGLVDLPEEMKETMDKFILGAGLRGKRLRLFGRRFTDHLKKLSRTEARGGVMGWLELETRRSRQRKRRELETILDGMSGSLTPNRQALAKSLEMQQISDPSKLASTERESTRKEATLAGGIPTGQQLNVPWKTKGFVTASKTQPGVIQETPTPSYEEMTAATYAATRLPGTFAAVVRVLDELKVRMPAFKPHKMLDFGSGPGTAIWAAQEVWHEGAPGQVLAVEPSWPMVALGQEIESSRKRAGVAGSSKIRWVSQLPTLKSSDPFNSQRRRYDLTTASYVLSEIPEADDRRRIARLLWERTSDVLVFIEPGTPVGAANIQEVRSFILDFERKRYRKTMQAATPTQKGDETLPISSMDLDPLAKQRLDAAGCHIVAPCPHDGECPMNGKKMWCHFNQRFLRTRAQKVTKIRPEKQHGPRDFQDERFSYVVFRRGWREKSWGQGISDVQIASNFFQDIKPDDEQVEWTPMKHHEKVSMPMEFDEDDGIDEEEEEDDVEDYPPIDLGQLDPETRNLMLASIMDGEENELPESTLFERTSLESLVSSLEAKALADEPDTNDDEEGEVDEHMRRLLESGFDVGSSAMSAILNRTEDGGGKPKDVRIPDRVERGNDEDDGMGNAPQAVGPASGSGELTTLVLPDRLSEVHLMDWPVLAPRDFSLTMAAASRWSRVIRPPRRRSGHVILDVCTSSCGSQSGPLANQKGKLQRHIVARSDMKSFMGRAGFRMAKKSRWGDLWPTYFNRNRKVLDL
ncbi:hypothetical protein BSKO_07449 [Bryopsis sp. KO-2023]|nr:hypothetical protein BSKO_07449 [Bryopsis sp. KO-2023]